MLKKKAVMAAMALLAVSACAPVDETPTAAGPATGAACGKDKLATLTAGKLTFGTDEPVYQPWFVDNKPESGQGFEAAVAYALAGKLGYAPADVVWTRVPFNAAIQPGKKAYDVDVNEFSITDERKQAVDFSSPYYDVAQAVIAPKNSPAAAAKTLAELKKVKLGAQVGTTSYDAAQRVAPEQQVAVYNTNDDAKAALGNGQIQALVLDLPTAFYVTSAELPDATIVGQLPRGDGKPEQFGLVLDKGSSLTPCVSGAVDGLRSDGTLAKLEQEWLTTAGNAPELK